MDTETAGRLQQTLSSLASAQKVNAAATIVAALIAKSEKQVSPQDAFRLLQQMAAAIASPGAGNHLGDDLF